MVFSAETWRHAQRNFSRFFSFRRQILLLVLVVIGGVTWLCLLPHGPSAELMEQQLRSELPPGSSYEEIRDWCQRNQTWVAWDYSANFPVPELSELPNTTSMAMIPLRGVARWDNSMRPCRTDMYLLLNREYRLLGYHARTYPRRAIWMVAVENLFR